MTREERIKRLETFIAEARLIRDKWTDKVDGKELACLLAAVSPEVAESEQASKCPADILPPFMAELTPWIDDAGTKEHWPHVIRRYADLLRRSDKMTPEKWTRLDYRCRKAALTEAMKYAGESLPVCETVMALLDRAIAGDMPSEKEWSAAEHAAEHAAESAARSAWSAAWSAESAARSAAWSARSAAWSAAWSARSAAWSARSAAWSAADRIIDGILDAWELEVGSE